MTVKTLTEKPKKNGDFGEKPECEVKDGRKNLENWIDHRLNYLDTYFGTL